jgi:hypothetical protein
MSDGPPRLDAVEIKVTVAAAMADRARREFGLADTRGRHRRIYFCEDVCGDAGRRGLPLLDGGIVLRLRANDGERDDSTVKLRPARRSGIGADWLRLRKDGDEEFRMEADWAGERKVLAASLTAEHGERTVADLMAGRRSLRRLFSDRQERYLRDCGDLVVDLDRLSVLGPVRATRWTLPAGGFAVTAERWQLPAGGPDGLDLLELSIRVEPAGAEIAQVSFEAMLRRHGVEPDVAQETKTRRVLELLPVAAGPERPG